MNKVITQIYEIQTSAEAKLMADCGVDHIGSVVASANDWKQPIIYETIRTVAAAGAKSSLILLFHNRDAIVSALSYYQPDIVHFCEDLSAFGRSRSGNGSLSPLIDMQAQIREDFPKIRIMRSIPIPQAGASAKLPVLDLARLLEPVSDYFLTDTWLTGENSQPVSGFVGITGKACSWSAAADLVAFSRIPVILAGGISPENVFESILAVRPAGVDSCTQTNAHDEFGRPIRFKKDPSKVRRLVSEVRRAEKEVMTISKTET